MLGTLQAGSQARRPERVRGPGKGTLRAFLPETVLSSCHVPARLRPRSAQAGFTVVEASVAGAIIILFLTSLFALNSTVMRLLGSAAETASASQNLQQRIEQVRLANWTQITDPAWVQINLLGTQTDASVNLPGLQETLTVTPYVSPSTSAVAAKAAALPPPPFTVTRSPAGAVTVSPAGYASSAAMASQEMVQVDLTLSWPGWNRQRTRALTTLVSRWGISK